MISMSDSEISVWTSSDGYRYIRVGPARDPEGVIAEHRAAAFAWGLIDGLDSEREIHHSDGIKCLTSEEQLEALEREDHIETHVEQALRRGEDPPRWVLESLPSERRRELGVES